MSEDDKEDLKTALKKTLIVIQWVVGMLLSLILSGLLFLIEKAAILTLSFFVFQDKRIPWTREIHLVEELKAILVGLETGKSFGSLIRESELSDQQQKN